MLGCSSRVHETNLPGANGRLQRNGRYNGKGGENTPSQLCERS